MSVAHIRSLVVPVAVIEAVVTVWCFATLCAVKMKGDGDKYTNLSLALGGGTEKGVGRGVERAPSCNPKRLSDCASDPLYAKLSRSPDTPDELVGGVGVPEVAALPNAAA